MSIPDLPDEYTEKMANIPGQLRRLTDRYLPSSLPNRIRWLLPVNTLVLMALACQMQGEVTDRLFWLLLLSGQGMLELPLTFAVIITGYGWAVNKRSYSDSRPGFSSAFSTFSVWYLLILFVVCLLLAMLITSTEIGQMFGLKFTAAPLGFLWLASVGMVVVIGHVGPHRRYLTIPLVLYAAMITLFFITA